MTLDHAWLPGLRGRGRLNLNESAYGPLPEVARELRAQMSEINRYPEFLPDRTRSVVATHLGVDDESVSVGAGATGVITQALQAAARRGLDAGIVDPVVVTAMPTFDGYPIIATMLGLRCRGVPLDAAGRVVLGDLRAAVTADTVAVVICSPHNPTGTVVDEQSLHEFIDDLPEHVIVVLDEAYIEFAERPPDLMRLIGTHERLLVIRTFSKAYGLAALRVGYGVGAQRLVGRVREFEMPFSVGPLAAAAVPLCLSRQDELTRRVNAMRTERAKMAALLAASWRAPVAGEGNFLFVGGPAGVELGSVLASCGVLVRSYRSDGVRITVGDDAATAEIGAVLHTVTATV